MKEKICECGDREVEHVKDMEQCFIPECGCKEFQESEASEKANREFSPEQQRVIDSLTKDEEVQEG